MYTTNQIRELFGNEVLKYLQDKNRGGISGEKGNTYEDFYAIYQIALLAQEVIETNQEINFSSQIFVFVDDLIIDRKGNTPLQHYQLKNSTSVSWGSGLKSIADDQRTPEGEVLPGIGGMIYNRLGFQGQEDKNKYVPEVVKSRRSKLAAKT